MAVYRELSVVVESCIALDLRSHLMRLVAKKGNQEASMDKKLLDPFA